MQAAVRPLQHDGRFSLWDFRSEGERRQSDAAGPEPEAGECARLIGLKHQLSTPALLPEPVPSPGLNRQAYNLRRQRPASTAAVADCLPSPALTDENTQP